MLFIHIYMTLIIITIIITLHFHAANLAGSSTFVILVAACLTPWLTCNYGATHISHNKRHFINFPEHQHNSSMFLLSFLSSPSEVLNESKTLVWCCLTRLLGWTIHRNDKKFNRFWKENSLSSKENSINNPWGQKLSPHTKRRRADCFHVRKHKSHRWTTDTFLKENIQFKTYKM